MVVRVKTLIIAEKPSVARDLTDALPGSFENKADWQAGHASGGRAAGRVSLSRPRLGSREIR